MKFSNTFAFMILVGFCCAGVAGSAVAQTPDASRENLQQRVEQLESQMEAMRAELTELKSALSGDANTAVVAEKKPVESTGAPSSSPQRKEQATEKHPTGIDLGPVRAVPYGTIYFNAFGNSGGTNNADDPLFATPTNQGNVSYAFSFLYKFTPQLSWGIEFRRFDTFYLQSGRQTSNHVNLGAAFSF